MSAETMVEQAVNLWEMRTVNVATANGNVSVSSLVCADFPGLAITPGIADKAGRYRVTHVGSGRSVSTRQYDESYTRLDSAERAIKAIAPLCDWTRTFASITADTALCEAVRVAVEASR